MKRTSIFYLLSVCFASIAQLVQGQPDNTKNLVYQETYPKIHDLVHTKLDVKFDYAKAYMYGKAWITLKPHFYSTDSLQLDAKGMDINKVAMVKGTTVSPLKYKYDGWFLRIKLDQTYKGGEKYTMYIDYTAKPNELKVNGSAAITDAKGLYFINPNGEDKSKPVQIWTQGEMEATSVWCPTIDKPNQKTTEEIIMTVPDKYVTLSNGKLISQKKNTDGTRTDHWKMDLPHAPYLFFMGVGDFSIVKDTYKGKEVSYYVEKEYAGVARKIFGHTPEMISFFEKITGVPYPWVKYAQMVGRDYVSGAMENTTATLHQESAQQDARQLIDGNIWEGTIAHELFHQWFGDYVTCESFSNLTLNESLADYSQYLWEEHKYGADAAGQENHNQMIGYLLTPGENEKDLVRFYYADKEEMFDAVSYNKGGRILHMLRNYIGDEAFFKGLNLYLVTNKFGTGEAHQFRLAFEEVTGKDLNWFFNQWYFGSGHPKVDISYAYGNSAKKVTVSIKQKQDDKTFKIPLAIDVYNGPSKVRHQVWMDSKEDTFTFNQAIEPTLVNVDADKVILWEKNDTRTLENFIHQYKYAGNYLDRREAIEALLKQQDNPIALEFLKTTLKDKYEGLRNFALESLDLTNEKVKAAVEPILFDLALNDKKSVVRATAIELLGSYGKIEYKDLFIKNLNDSSYSVAGAALTALSQVDPQASLAEAKRQMILKTNGKLTESMLKVLMEFDSGDDIDFIANKYNEMPLSASKFRATEGIGAYLNRIQNIENFKKGVDMITRFRDAISKIYQGKSDSYFNDRIIGALIEAKTEAGLNDQVEYLKSKLPK